MMSQRLKYIDADVARWYTTTESNVLVGGVPDFCKKEDVKTKIVNDVGDDI